MIPSGALTLLFLLTAAAEHLTPVCLELGGKSPTIIDESVTDLELVAQVLRVVRSLAMAPSNLHSNLSMTNL